MALEFFLSVNGFRVFGGSDGLGFIWSRLQCFRVWAWRLHGLGLKLLGFEVFVL